MTDLPSMNLDFSKSATVWKFLHDKSFVRGLMVRWDRESHTAVLLRLC